jgi:hypothetical protein
MSATSRHPKVDLDSVAKDDSVCHSCRGVSLSLYRKLYDRQFGFCKGSSRKRRSRLRRTWPSCLGSNRRGRGTAQRMSAGASDASPSGSSRGRVADVVLATTISRSLGVLRLKRATALQELVNFLRIDASMEEVRSRCFAATVCAEHEDSPPLEDEIRIPLR